MRARATILVCGGTGSGKTTTLNVLSGFIGAGERVVTIEDAAELRLSQPHVIRLEARPPNLEGRGEVTIRRLVRNALRMRPDRIVVGEVRGPEALDMLTALSTGHDGSLSTIHAGTPAEALRRVETLALMAGLGLPHAALREQVADAFDLVVCQARAADGTRRVVAVAEVIRVAGGPAAREIYSWRRGRGHWRAALSEGLAARLAAAGVPSGLPIAAVAAAGRPGTSRPGLTDPRRARPGDRRSAADLAAQGHDPNRGPVVRRRGGRRAGRVGGARGGRALARGRRARAARWSRSCAPPMRAGRRPRPERRRLALLATGALAAAGWLVGGVALGALAAILGPALVVAAVRTRRRHYARAVGRGAAAAARTLADAVAAGHSIRGAIAVASGGLEGPAGHELRTTARALALGEPTADALESLRRRAADPAWDAIVAGILLQRDAGGDLVGLLRSQAAALEAADRIGRDARAATAQARFTARLVLVLPAGAAALAELASPGLIAGLLDHPLSVWLVGHGRPPPGHRDRGRRPARADPMNTGCSRPMSALRGRACAADDTGRACAPMTASTVRRR